MLAANTIQLVPQGYTVAERIMEMQLIEKKKKKGCVFVPSWEKDFTRLGEDAVLF